MKSLYPHNQDGLEKLLKSFRTTKRAAITQPTGTGKAYIAAAYIHSRPELKVAYLSPSTRIFDHVRDIFKGSEDELINTEFISYQKLERMSEEDIEGMHYDCIILDEYHRCGAKKWQKKIKMLEKANPEAFYLGLSATPIRYLDDMRDMTEELFQGNIVHQYKMAQAIADGILPKPMYVLGDIDRESAYNNAKERYEELVKENVSTTFLRELNKCLDDMYRNIHNAAGVEKIFEKYMPSNAKLIVFCRDYKHLVKIKETMRNWLGAKTLHEYVCRADNSDNLDANKQLVAFENDSENCVRLLYTVDMLNEGVHLADVDGVVLLRPTKSPNVYLQQIGRCLASGKLAKQPIIFDLVNNYQKARVKETNDRAADIEFGGSAGGPGRGISNEFRYMDFSIEDDVLSYQELIERFDTIEGNKRLEVLKENVKELKMLYDKRRNSKA